MRNGCEKDMVMVSSSFLVSTTSLSFY